MSQDHSTTSIEQVSGQGIATKAEETRSVVHGTAYKYGGKNPTDGFDCSGFVSWVFAQLFSNNAGQFQLTAKGFANSALFAEVTAEQKSPGDLIYFPAENGQVAHIGIVYDGEYWIGSQSSTGVAKVKHTNPYWNARSKKFFRLRSISVASIQAGRASLLA